MTAHTTELSLEVKISFAANATCFFNYLLLPPPPQTFVFTLMSIFLKSSLYSCVWDGLMWQRVRMYVKLSKHEKWKSFIWDFLMKTSKKREFIFVEIQLTYGNRPKNTCFDKVHLISFPRKLWSLKPFHRESFERVHTIDDAFSHPFRRLSPNWKSSGPNLTLFRLHEDLSFSSGRNIVYSITRNIFSLRHTNPKFTIAASKISCCSDIRNRKILWKGFGSLSRFLLAPPFRASLHIPARLAHSSLQTSVRQTVSLLIQKVMRGPQKGAWRHFLSYQQI